jgi:putative PIN family toxin of toxin-antitoxin system
MNLKTVVVDTNLIIAALIPKASKIREILFDAKFTFYSPNFVITEIYIHKDKLIRYSKLNEQELYLYLNEIVERITFVPVGYISKESRQKAYDLCKEVDLKDIPFVALAIELKIPLWTGDKKLKVGLRLKGFNNFYTG